MTPEEKAKDLIEKFSNYACWGRFDDEYENLQNAKKCALTAVNVALEFIGGDLSESFDKTLYLLEVKEEIEKL
jgi:hypothetical protein